MADFAIICPHCNHSLDCPEELVGQSAECPACNGIVIIPNDPVAPVSSCPPPLFSKGPTIQNTKACGPVEKSTTIIQRSRSMPMKSTDLITERKVSVLLGVGIFFIPYVFCWFTLRKGHSNAARIVAFVWLVFAIMISQISIGKQSASYRARTSSIAVLTLDNDTEIVLLSDLLAQYQNNEVRADALYKGKTIGMSGVVVDVKKDILGEIYVILKDARMNDFEIPQAQCMFKGKNASQVVNLNKGDVIGIFGRVSGLMMNVIIRDCSVAVVNGKRQI